MNKSLAELTAEVLQFVDERDWAKFHTPRQLATAIAIEAAELQETLLWKDDAEVRALITSESGSLRVRHEVADILIYVLLMAAASGIDLSAAVREKLAYNADKYPVEESKGRATKYRVLPTAGQE